jgi:predicted LPLAT superfamily acyltransferase
VVVIFPYRNRSGEYALQLAKIIRVPANLGRSAKAYLPYALEFVEALEQFVSEHPYQFFNFYDMWHHAPTVKE